MYFIQRFNTIIGALDVRVKLYSEIYPSGRRTAYVLNVDIYRNFDFIGSEGNGLILWNADFYFYPRSIGSNQCFAINFMDPTGEPKWKRRVALA